MGLARRGRPHRRAPLLSLRVLVTETLDPDGAMHRWASPDLTALGHEVLPLPTQELAPLLGPDGLAALILGLAREWRPDLVVLCPPYDHLGRRALDELTSLGATPIAYAFDEPLFAPARAHHTSWRDALAGYAHVFATAPEAARALVSAGLSASWLRWAASPEAFAERVAPDPAIGREVVLVGRPYRRRVELLAHLAEAGLPVRVFGHGWDHLAPPGVALGGPLSGPAMHGVLAAAGVIVTTGDWEGEPVPMVKYRLLEAALCGAVQVAQASPDLDAYFPAAELPRYTTAAELATTCGGLLADPTARARAAAARVRALAEHTWRARWPELLAALGPRAPRPAPRAPATPPTYLAALALLAHDAERRGHAALARHAFELWSSLDPAASTPRFGLARLALADPPACAAAAAAARSLRDADPTSADDLYARLPTTIGTGLGAIGYLDPRAEFIALELHATSLSDPRRALALTQELAHGPADRLLAVAAVLMPTEYAADAWRTLFGAALMARPVALGDVAAAHASRWREHLDALG